MKRAFVAGGLFAMVFAAGLFMSNQSEAKVVPAIQVEQTTESEELPALGCDLEEVAKKCSTSSDCPNSKCKSGKCGGCSTSSDCKYGKCKSGQ